MCTPNKLFENIPLKYCIMDAVIIFFFIQLHSKILTKTNNCFILYFHLEILVVQI